LFDVPFVNSTRQITSHGGIDSVDHINVGKEFHDLLFRQDSFLSEGLHESLFVAINVVVIIVMINVIIFLSSFLFAPFFFTQDALCSH